MLKWSGTDCAVRSHNWHTNSYMRFCAISICSIYIMPKAKGKALGLGHIFTVSILIGGCVFYSPSLCVPPFCHFAAVQCGYILVAKWRHTQAWQIKKHILRLKYLRSKYRIELWAWCKSNILHRNAVTHNYLCVNSANILRNQCLLAVSCGKL